MWMDAVDVDDGAIEIRTSIGHGINSRRVAADPLGSLANN